MDILNSIWEGDFWINGNLNVSGTFPGTTGSQGPTGATGSQGTTGTTGPTGVAVSPFTNIVIVGGTAHLPAPSGGKHTLLANTLYWIDATVLNLGTNYIEFSNGSTLRGNSSLSNTIVYGGTGAALRGTDVNASISFISTSASKAYDFTNTARDKFLSIQQVGIANQTSQSTITGYNVFVTFIVNYINCVGGFNLTDNGKVIYRYHNWEDTCSGSFLTANPNTYTEFNITGCDIHVATGASNKGIDVTSTNISSAILEGCTFEGSAPVSQRLIGVNGNTTGWTIQFGANVGISGIQFIDIEINTTETTLPNASGNYVDAASSKGFALRLADYDPLATTMQGRLTTLWTSPTIAMSVQLRNFTTSTNIGVASVKGTGTNFILQTAFNNITPGQEYTGLFIKPTNGSTAIRKGVKLTLKIF